MLCAPTSPSGLGSKTSLGPTTRGTPGCPRRPDGDVGRPCTPVRACVRGGHACWGLLLRIQAFARPSEFFAKKNWLTKISRKIFSRKIVHENCAEAGRRGAASSWQLAGSNRQPAARQLEARCYRASQPWAPASQPDACSQHPAASRCPILATGLSVMLARMGFFSPEIIPTLCICILPLNPGLRPVRQAGPDGFLPPREHSNLMYLHLAAQPWTPACPSCWPGWVPSPQRAF